MQIMKDVKKQYGEETSDISRQEMQEQIQAIHNEALAANKQGDLDAHKMADITSKIVQPLGFDEEQMQAFKNLMIDIFHEETDNENISEIMMNGTDNR